MTTITEKKSANRVVSPSLTRIREAVVRYKTIAKVEEPVTSPERLAELFRKVARNNVQEHVYLFCLDASGAVVNCSLVFTGTANAAPFHPREIFQIAILVGACSIVMAHNHPSGSLKPSRADRELTRGVQAAGELLGIPLLDHVIVTDSGYNSAHKEGWL